MKRFCVPFFMLLFYGMLAPACAQAQPDSSTYPVTLSWNSNSSGRGDAPGPPYDGVYQIDGAYPKLIATGASTTLSVQAGPHRLSFGDTGVFVTFTVAAPVVPSTVFTVSCNALPTIDCSTAGTVTLHTASITITETNPNPGMPNYTGCYTPNWKYDGFDQAGYGPPDTTRQSFAVPLGLTLYLDDGAHLGGSTIGFDVNSNGVIENISPPGAAAAKQDVLALTPVPVSLQSNAYTGALYLSGFATNNCSDMSVNKQIIGSATPQTFNLLPGLRYSLDNGTENYGTALSFAVSHDGSAVKRISPQESATGGASGKPPSASLTLSMNTMTVTAAAGTKYWVSSYRLSPNTGPYTQPNQSIPLIDGLFVWIQAYGTGQAYVVMPGCDQTLYKGTPQQLKLVFSAKHTDEACSIPYPQTL